MKKRPQIRLLDEPAGPAESPRCAVLAAELPFLGERVTVRAEVPDFRAALADVVGLAGAICDRLTAAVIRRVHRDGREIFCAKGCGACCTCYLVPLTVPEAFRIVEALRAQPASERRRLELAYDQAAATLASSGLAEAFAGLDRDDPDRFAAQRELAGEWWSRQRFTCPLLRDQACSQYAVRPMPCREVLALSPPELCAENRMERARRPFPMHAVLARWAAELEDAQPTLVLMPNLLPWTDGKAGRAQRTWRSIGMVRRFLDVLTDLATRAAARGQGTDGEAP